MTRVLVALCVCAWTAGSLYAADVTSYTVRLDGRAGDLVPVTLTVTYADATGTALVVPTGFATLHDVRCVSCPVGTMVATKPSGAATAVMLGLPPAAAATGELTVAFTTPSPFVATTPAPGERATLPAGTRILRHAFVNTEPVSIGSYRFEAIFETGYRAHAIREALPKLRKNEAGPRARLASVAGEPGVFLQVGRLRQGESTSLNVELVPQGHSWAWMIAGLLLSVLYLVFFRDLVKPRPATSEHPQ